MSLTDLHAASVVTVEENVDAVTVGLAADGGSPYLILQCARTAPGADDVATGTDSYCVMDSDGAVHYGGITRADLADGTLRLTFDADAALELALDPAGAEVAIGVPAGTVAELAAGLRRVLTYGNPAATPALHGI